MENAGTGVTIDLHWALTPPRWPAKPSCAEFWEQAVEIQVNGFGIRTLKPEDLLLYLVVHAAKDGWHRLRMLCDLAELIRSHPGWDWDRSIERAKACGCRRLLLIAALLAAQLLGAPVPDWVEAQAMNDSEASIVCQRIVRHQS